jgi:hypothetical protein
VILFLASTVETFGFVNGKKRSQQSIACYLLFMCCAQGITQSCRLFWLTNSDLLYEPKCGGNVGGGGCGISGNEINSMEP